MAERGWPSTLAQPQRVALRRHSSPMQHSGLLRLSQPRSAIMGIAEQPLTGLASQVKAGRLHSLPQHRVESCVSKKKRVPKFLQALRAGRRQQSFSSTESVVAATGTSLRAEVENVRNLASKGDGRVIGFNQLVFFSTETRDAWMLDWEDELAICLMKDGVPQAVEVSETERQFAIPWQGRYHIEGELFAYIDNETPTHARVIGGYPTAAIQHTIERLRRGTGPLPFP
jgi:hypothetical protein